MGKKKFINNFYEHLWGQLLVLLERNKPVSPVRKKKEALLTEMLTDLGDNPEDCPLTGHLAS